ncbi:DUF6492 family protein [Cellulomonas alba]|uniref:DUF6492 family protein n=1 Tax=Cellulomonas alba TaxID=3053467 RepID=A0ABT7SH94_9CELL|nr:DUF6492 family protein [Cellulomonas alba]MDM7855568.1 DUF6492 family protein [Cellulomonas alba]
MRPLTFVTPVFEAELPLLELQARSLARRLPADEGHELLVLDNTARGLGRAARARLEAAYGEHLPHVRVLRPSDVCPMPPTSGWRGQQVLKLAVARLVRTPRYVALDAKNHLVGSLDDAFVEGPDGRTRVRAHGFADHPLRPALEHVLGYLGVDPAGAVERFPATVTPYVLDTATVRDVVADVESRSGRPFGDEFVAHELTEFFLYAGWILRADGTLERRLELTSDPNPTVWPRGAADVATTVEEVRRTGAPFLGVHRNAVPRLDDEGRRLLAELWAERGLLASPADGVDLLAGMARDHEHQRRQQRVRDVRARLLGPVRRLTGTAGGSRART